MRSEMSDHGHFRDEQADLCATVDGRNPFMNIIS